MKTEKIPYEMIHKIAREICQGYSPIDLTSLEEVSWAFPVEGNERLDYVRNGFMKRIPNTQEGNAMKQIMTYKNFRNILTYLNEGRTLPNGAIPNHTLPVGDADDGAYMVYPYLRQRDVIQGKESIEMENGLFWESMPEGLVKAVLKVEGTGRGKIVDEWGKQTEQLGSSAYVDENLTREYLINLSNAIELGSQHFRELGSKQNKADEYDQLVVDSQPEIWTPETNFQWAYFNKKGEPRLVSGSVIKNTGTKIEFEVGEQIRERDIERFKGYGEKGMLWKLIHAKK